MPKHILDTLRYQSNTKSVNDNESPILCPHTTQTINSLFKFFYAICRGFEKQYQDPKRLNIEKTQWIKAFMDVGIANITQCKYGIKQARLESPIFTPTIKQFLEWNDEPLPGYEYPDVEQAYNEACKNSHFAQAVKAWSHAVVKHAWQNTSSWRLQQEPREKTFHAFKKNYNYAIKLHRQDELLEQIEDTAPNQKHAKEERGKKKKIAEIAEKQGVKDYLTARKFLKNLLEK